MLLSFLIDVLHKWCLVKLLLPVKPEKWVYLQVQWRCSFKLKFDVHSNLALLYNDIFGDSIFGDHVFYRLSNW